MHLSKPAMFFSILLMAPTSLFINALPADGPISGRATPLQAEALVFQLVECTSANGISPEAVTLTQDICSPLPTSIQIVSFQSGKSLNIKIDLDKFDCTITYYRGQQCGDPSIGQTQVVAGPQAGPCVEFSLLPQLPNLALGAGSAKLTCTTISG